MQPKITSSSKKCLQASAIHQKSMFKVNNANTTKDVKYVQS